MLAATPLARTFGEATAELDTTIQDYVVELLDRELSEAAPRRSGREEQE